MKNNLKLSVFIALFAALISVGSYIAINIGPLNIVLANFFVFLAAMILGFPWAAASVSLFLLIGLLGLPVFTNGGSGIAQFAGPSGGFLIGYLAASLIIPLIASKSPRKYVRNIIAVTAGILIIFVFGIPWFKYKMEFTWTKTFLTAFLPFLPLDILKGTAAVFLAGNISVDLGSGNARA